MNGYGSETHAPAVLPPLPVPDRYNYIAVFLTLACNLRCSYCINAFSRRPVNSARLAGKEWVRALNRIVTRPDLPITLQGGEPSLHPDFVAILNGLRPDMPVDILTNLQFDVDDFMARVAPERVRRDAPYASIRVSYHPETMDIVALVPKVRRLLDRGYSVGIWVVLHPDNDRAIEEAREVCMREGIDFRTKPFLGWHRGQLHGVYKYPEALAGEAGPRVECRTSELIVGPGGDVYRCHADLYAGRPPIGALKDPSFRIEDGYRPCGRFGLCNPCDVKIKTNRFQRFGHTSVEIRTAP